MLDEYIENIYRSKKTTLDESGIEVFRSTQVTLRNIDENLKYREISIGQLPQLKSTSVKRGANPITLKRQTLHAGDILISARSKLERIGLVLNRHLRDNIPTVAMNGIIIIRTGNEELGYFIKSHLEASEVQEFVNNDPLTIKNGKRVITADIILQLPFPDIIKKDFSIFKEKKEFIDSLRSKSFRFQTRIARLGNLQLAKASSLEITNADSYNPAEWKKIEDALNEVEKNVESLSEKLGLMAQMSI